MAWIYWKLYWSCQCTWNDFQNWRSYCGGKLLNQIVLIQDKEKSESKFLKLAENVFVGLYHHCIQKGPEIRILLNTNRTFRPHGLPRQKLAERRKDCFQVEGNCRAHAQWHPDIRMPRLHMSEEHRDIRMVHLSNRFRTVLEGVAYWSG